MTSVAKVRSIERGIVTQGSFTRPLEWKRKKL